MASVESVPPAPNLLFVYGTLMSASRHAMHARLARDARLLGPASLRGRLFRVRTYPGAVDSADDADLIHGEASELLRPHPLLEELDAYEGCGPRDAPPHLYVRAQRPVLFPDGRHGEAWVYLYNRPTAGLERIASGRWR